MAFIFPIRSPVGAMMDDSVANFMSTGVLWLGIYLFQLLLVSEAL